PAEVEALQLVAAVAAGPLGDLGRLHALGHDGDPHQPAHGDDGLHDGGVAWQAEDQAAVDLDAVDGCFAEPGQVGIPGAEVVDGDAHAQRADPFQVFVDGAAAFHQHRF